MRQLPLASVSAVRVAPVALSVAVVVTPSMAAPDGSLTLFVIALVGTPCAF